MDEDAGVWEVENLHRRKSVTEQEDAQTCKDVRNGHDVINHAGVSGIVLIISYVNEDVGSGERKTESWFQKYSD